MNPESLYLTNRQRLWLKCSGASIEDDQVSALESLATGDLTQSYVFWEEYLDEGFDEFEGSDALEDAEQEAAEWVRSHNFPSLLRSILLHPENADVEVIKVSFAQTCSSMRPDSFGGHAYLVTRDQWAIFGTDTYDVTKSGEIFPCIPAIHRFAEEGSNFVKVEQTVS